MGLQNREEGNYITILGGKFSQRVHEGSEGSVMRTNKVGKVVHERYYDSFTAKLIGIKVKDGDYGKTWNFLFKDKEDVYTLQMSYSNGLAKAFLKMLPNIDVSKEMKLSPSQKEEDGKTKTSLFVNQDGQSIKHAYTRENPNGMPQMEEITVKGEKVWDDTKQIAFLHDMVNTTIVPKLQGTTAPVSAPAQTTGEIDPEDIPF